MTQQEFDEALRRTRERHAARLWMRPWEHGAFAAIEFPSNITDLTVDEDGHLVVVTETGVSVIKELPT